MERVPAIVVEPDAAAGAWMAAHPSNSPRVISYEVHRCCGGGRLCEVRVREASKRDTGREHVAAEGPGGLVLLVDARAAARLPGRVGLTVRGTGPFRRLDLDLDGAGWAALLYD